MRYKMNDYKKRVKDNKLLKIWYEMKRRCLDKNCKDYRNYGNKGITICKEWLDYENFRLWALEHGYQEGLSIDRVDNSKGYSPNNCEWITLVENVKRMYDYYGGSPLKGKHIKEETKNKISNAIKNKYQNDIDYRNKTKHNRDTNGRTKISTEQLKCILDRYNNGETKLEIYKDYQIISKSQFYRLFK